MTTSVVRVLLADDAADLRNYLRIIVELDERFTVVGEAENGAQAIELAAATQPDWVLLDLAMPVMDGLQAIPRLREVAPKTRIAVLTGFDDDGIARTALDLGADLYLNKATAVLKLPAPLLDGGMPTAA